MKWIIYLLVTAFSVQCSLAQTWEDTVAIIERSFDQYSPGSPGCQLSVSRNGDLIFSKAWGMADLERKVVLSTESVIEAGSVSKQFTAAAILLLEQQGKLSIDDDIRKYVPEIPDYGNKITIRHMLHHTSGLRDWGAVAGLSGWERGTKFYTNDDALEIIARQKLLNNIPGGEYIYSNSNYNLMAIIVQRVSGSSLALFTRKYIFEPAGMTHTQWRDDPNRIVTNRAIAYSKTGIGYEIDMPNEYVYGNGGLLTTTEDLVKWSAYYQSGKLGTSSILSKQLQTDPFNNGVINTYAAGLNIGNVMGWKNISHGGATAGYRAYLETFPELNLTIAVLSNTSQFDIGTQAGRVRNIFVADKTGSAIPTAKVATATVDNLNALQGLYKNERDKSTFRLTVKNDSLIVDNGPILRAVSPYQFLGAGFSLKMVSGKMLLFRFAQGDTTIITKVDPVTLTENELTAYEGVYFSEETQSYVKIKKQNNGLFVSFKPGSDYSMSATYADAFRIVSLGCNIEFSRGRRKEIVALKMSVTRARNVEFKRVNSR
jgi:CubicO group peptidase (beta-lactamase class C family)